MKPTTDEAQLTRWIDGELSEAEAEAAARLEAHPDCQAERESARALGDSLRQAFAATPDIPYPDFFNHQIRRRIGEDVFSRTRELEPVDAEAGEAMRFPLFQRLRWLSAFGFVVAAGALVVMVLRQGPGDRSEVVSTYTPSVGATAVAAYDAASGATVIRLDGVPPIPADMVVGDPPGGPRADSAQAGRVLFSIDRGTFGCPASVLSGDNPADPLPGTMLVQF